MSNLKMSTKLSSTMLPEPKQPETKKPFRKLGLIKKRAVFPTSVRLKAKELVALDRVVRAVNDMLETDGGEPLKSSIIMRGLIHVGASTAPDKIIEHIKNNIL